MVKTVSTRFSIVSLSAVVSITLVGCVDARGAYDDFGSRLPDGGGGGVDGEEVSALPDVDGEWLLAVRPNLPEDRIIQFRATLDLTAVTANTGLIDVFAQPLKVSDRTAVGEIFEALAAEVASDATFSAPLVGLLPGEANPVTSSDAAVDATMHAHLRSADFVCGELEGQAGALPLAGTTWAAIRIVEGSPLPAPIFRCADQPAE
jgi:hypothetical protein